MFQEQITLGSAFILSFLILFIFGIGLWIGIVFGKKIRD